MKEKLLSGWTFSRLLYLIMGTFLVIQSFQDRQWIGVVFGAYFASMGLFAFGCASGQCNLQDRSPVSQPSKSQSDITL